MGENTFNMDDWEAIGEYDKQAGRHHAFVAPRKDVVIDGVTIKKGEKIRIEESYKYSREEAKHLWEMAKLAENTVWANAKGDYGECTGCNHGQVTFLICPRSPFCVQASGLLPYQTPRVCSKARTHSCRVAGALEGMGCGFQTNDSRRGAAFQAHQTP